MARCRPGGGRGSSRLRKLTPHTRLNVPPAQIGPAPERHGVRQMRSELPSWLELFATCPQSKDPHAGSYRSRVAEIARWSERAGYRGILVYTDNSLVDPWLVAQLVVGATDRLCPLVAVQPVYMHPYTVAKIVASIGHVYGRRVYLNMVAGGFRNDLLSLGDDTPHDERYERAVEYALIVERLLAGSRVSFEGRFYRMQNVLLAPTLPPELTPG